MTSLFERWATKVDIGDGNGCWLWCGALSRGYGIMSAVRPDIVPLKAHRVAYEFFIGPIDDGLVVRHRCDTPNCVNPAHLTLGTQKDNMRDASKRGRLNPKSFQNLRPGCPGYHGAGPIPAGKRT